MTGEVERSVKLRVATSCGFVGNNFRTLSPKCTYQYVHSGNSGFQNRGHEDFCRPSFPDPTERVSESVAKEQGNIDSNLEIFRLHEILANMLSPNRMCFVVSPQSHEQHRPE